MPTADQLDLQLTGLTSKQVGIEAVQTAIIAEDAALDAIAIASAAIAAAIVAKTPRVGTVVSVNFLTGACVFDTTSYASLAAATTAGAITGTTLRVLSSGLLVEPAVTNKLPNSLTVAGATWGKNGSPAPTVTDGGGASLNLNGTAAALSVFAEAVGTSSWGITETVSLVASATYRISWVFRRRSGKNRDPGISVIVPGGGSARVAYNLDTSTITYLNTAFSDAHIVNLGSGNYRLDTLLTTPSTAGNNAFYFRPMTNGNTTLPAPDYAGATDDGCEWGYFQCELVTGSALPSSPIVTVAAGVTRPVDAPVIVLPPFGPYTVTLTLDNAATVVYTGVGNGPFTIPPVAIGRKITQFVGSV